ncbi:MAG: ABC-F family ATP-binding cassette domain-containing protein [Kiritimatiellae bacterium]|nr:ABC-F family ATP-binding cassette domain-containing protein [Kiritimatiellia bacterium]
MLEFQDISIHFGSQEVLRNVQLRINPGEHVGIVGPNGAGKSTLFGLITGEISPYRGKCVVPNGHRIGYVRQHLPDAASQTPLVDFACEGVPELLKIEQRIHKIEHDLHEAAGEERERLLRRLGKLQSDFEHLGGYNIRSRAEATLCGLGFRAEALHNPLQSFSGGWRMRAELARALVGHPDTLLLDEPSNYLDVPAVEWLQRFLREFQGTLMLISHDRYLLKSLTNITIEVAGGLVTRYPGGLAFYAEERERRHRTFAAATRNQDRKREQLERFITRFRATSTKAAQVQSRIKELEKLEAIDSPIVTRNTASIRIAKPPHCGAEILRLENAGLTYDANHWVLRGLDFRIERGDRIALVGYNGMGKTTLLRIMAGQREPSEGRVVLGHKVKIGYQSQEFAETMSPERSVFDIVAAQSAEASSGDVRSILGGFGFVGDAVSKPSGVLSGGERIRLAFARLFVNPPNVLLLDEPTTHLDIDGRETLEKALDDYAGTVCFVSHDIDFVRRIATRIVALDETGVTRYAGGYDYYLEKRNEGSPNTTSARNNDATGGRGKENRRERAEQRKQRTKATRGLKRQLAATEAEVDALEQERNTLAENLAQRADAVDFAEINKRLQEIHSSLDRLTRQWERIAYELEDVESQ